MTLEEIKECTTMQDVLNERGLSTRRGMMSCPFHGKDSNPSMRIYKDGYHCFACGANGDVVSFVQKYDGVTFKEAFLSLGGTYSNNLSNRSKILSKIKRQRAMEERRIALKKEEAFNRTVYETLTIARTVANVYEPFSDGWCDAMNIKQYLETVIEYLINKEEGVNPYNVLRKCREFRQKYYLAAGSL